MEHIDNTSNTIIAFAYSSTIVLIALGIAVLIG